jgi:predicted component of type VI protein secretion system
MPIKVNLVVASGVHQGKQIPIPGEQFLIGRDPQCQLRPASQMVSKQHCAIVIKDDRVVLKDFGSTNGTFLNDSQLEPNSVKELKPGDLVKVGPLDFTVQFVGGKASDSTPMPDQLKAVGSQSVEKLRAAAGQSTVTQADAPAPKTGSSTALKPAALSAEHDDIASMLLGMDDDGPSPAPVPEGSTIMEMPAAVLTAAMEAEKKKTEKNAVPTREDSSNAASDILKKMMRRPR